VPVAAPADKGRVVIGTFHYSGEADAGAVSVRMAWRDSERMGRLVLAPELHASLSASAYPALDSEGLALESALSYAVFIAMSAEIPLVLTGDRSVWNKQWGNLLPLAAADEERVVRRGSVRH
jgi:hypothetical protein